MIGQTSEASFRTAKVAVRLTRQADPESGDASSRGDCRRERPCRMRAAEMSGEEKRGDEGVAERPVILVQALGLGGAAEDAGQRRRDSRQTEGDLEEEDAHCSEAEPGVPGLHRRGADRSSQPRVDAMGKENEGQGFGDGP